jgi:hypothetical protein
VRGISVRVLSIAARRYVAGLCDAHYASLERRGYAVGRMP